MKALLIIDMQKGSFMPQTPRYDTDGVVKRINDLANIFRERKYAVIYVQHDGTGSGEFEKHTSEWENLDTLVVEQTDIMIDKYANDIFYKSNLQAVLSELNVKELFVTGCATDFCVESSIQSALTKDYNITVVSDGHTTGNRPHLNAKQVINHYNWVWQNMLPTKGRVTVQSFAEIKQSLKL